MFSSSEVITFLFIPLTILLHRNLISIWAMTWPYYDLALCKTGADRFQVEDDDVAASPEP